MNIQFAKSKAGHDKDQLYFILKVEEEFVYLVNGTTRPLDKPKKKRKKQKKPKRRKKRRRQKP